MSRFVDNRRRESTIKRDNMVHEEYTKLVKELGCLINVVSKTYIYARISEMTGLCPKTVAFILNHTDKNRL
jgi:hypothetical protein